MDLDQLRKDIRTQGIEVVLASNPRNPTGQVVQRDELKELVRLSRESSTTLILDEFYSWYMYPEKEEDFGKSLSAAEYVEGGCDVAVLCSC